MKVGSLVYATEQGLGILGKSFYDAGVVTDVLVVRHGRRPEREDWYPGKPRVSSLHGDAKLIRDFIKTMDVMLFFETPFDWTLIPFCREQKVKSVLMPMYECMPELLPYSPDQFICPSLLDMDYYPQSQWGEATCFIPVPVDDVITQRWKLRTEAKVFVHNAGHGGLRGRNGTKEVVEAIRYVKSDARFIIRCQDKQSFPPYSELLGRVDYHEGTVPYNQLFTTGDVFLFPERFNGLSLPLQEAYASGMLVMCGNRYPMNSWLPTDPLIPPNRISNNERVAPRCNPFKESFFSPQDIAATVNAWYGRDITEYSKKGRQWALQNSWSNLKSKYIEVLGR